MGDFELCLSSAEEGEIFETNKSESSISIEFPRHMSVLQYCYFPGTHLFVGNNTIPRMSDYHGHMLTTKIKKKLKKDLVQPFNIILLLKDRSFFENKFTFITDIKSITRPCNVFKLVSVHKNIKEVNVISHAKSIIKDEYNTMCNNFIFDDKKMDVSPEVLNYTKKKYILIKDSILSKINNSNCYIFFKIVKTKRGTTYVFEDFFYYQVLFYEYLNIYFEEVMKQYESSELRTYINDEVYLSVFSSSIFYKRNKEFRYFNGVDVCRNYVSIINRYNIDIKEIEEVPTSDIYQLCTIDLEEGDYALNSNKIFKIGINGEKKEFEGLIYDDFLNQ